MTKLLDFPVKINEVIMNNYKKYIIEIPIRSPPSKPFSSMLKIFSSFFKDDNLSFAFCIVASLSPDLDSVVLNLFSSSFNLRDSSLTFLKPSN